MCRCRRRWACSRCSASAWDSSPLPTTRPLWPAQQLGYRYVSGDDLSRAVTARGGVEREPQSDETEGRALSIWEQLGEQLTGGREAYIAALKAVVTELAVADNVVIVGHGAGRFL